MSHRFFCHRFNILVSSVKQSLISSESGVWPTPVTPASFIASTTKSRAVLIYYQPLVLGASGSTEGGSTAGTEEGSRNAFSSSSLLAILSPTHIGYLVCPYSFKMLGSLPKPGCGLETSYLLKYK